MNAEQFQVFLQSLTTLTKTLGEQGQEITQFTTAIKKDSKTENVESSIYNPANKLKINIKLPMYLGDTSENVFM